MANVALIIAGGTGARMHQDIPKQFLTVNDKPIIVYTMEAFERHPEIDGIVIACLDGWQKALDAYINQFNITKVKKVVVAGKNGQDSIRNGVFAIAELYNDDDLILVHDAIRPMLSEDIITNNINVCREKGNAITVIPCMEAMLRSDDEIESEESILRNSLFRAQTPQTVSVGDMVKLHKDALEKGITNSVATCTLLLELGHKTFFAKGSELNIKITTLEDIKIFKALLATKDSAWMKQE
ncbi:2-C-methyl-D-erythritol 4-phosphate cytidylyltransferase [Butyrivibrio sp. CB08]|uniref:IspD/TarI family cytidylyltransferase n=1 Tax=Butyrivibrio sp. CB08 TaxID=2364879 RepID=UPI000EAA1CAA|nr:IspD/TarI family cytidylyltransferase [Butyrivibrio sp. CB08]RKM60417.1 2-C-methyl-D-erythritol 4-phosphate cytidylyltransferase [Butyrivibrio sp. CB08]